MAGMDDDGGRDEASLIGGTLVERARSLLRAGLLVLLDFGDDGFVGL
jgi:hypothetical protein